MAGRRARSGHETTAPSRSRIRRPARLATSTSWVATTMVTASSPDCNSFRSDITSCALAESRLPVGSSAMITRGRFAKARAIATRCCSPPDRREGRWSKRPPRPTRSNSSAERSRRSDLGGSVGNHGDADVLFGSQCGDQVELLEDETDLLTPDTRQAGVGRRAHLVPLEADRPARRDVESPEQLKQRALARSTGPFHRDELPRLDVEVDVVEGQNGRAPPHVAALHSPQLVERPGRHEPGRARRGRVLLRQRRH